MRLIGQGDGDLIVDGNILGRNSLRVKARGDIAAGMNTRQMDQTLTWWVGNQVGHQSIGSLAPLFRNPPFSTRSPGRGSAYAKRPSARTRRTMGHAVGRGKDRSLCTELYPDI
mmetsp:Transcript_28736/g.54448  ORF Transcript_28736/g.54448 Transcript_28736/m.54448 type:complete len:113 (+) Transcript_28736:705-1043(+)